MTTFVPAAHVALESGVPIEDALGKMSLATDYGASTAGTAAVNTTAINSAIAASGATGFVVVAPGIAYNEVDLVMVDGVVVMVYSTNGTVMYLVKDQGSTLPVVKGGLVIKSKGNTGIFLRSLDYGVSAEPIVQILDATSGDLAAAELKNLLMSETADLTAPSANKAKLYVRDDGAGKTQLIVRFPTGNPIAVATEGRDTNLTATTTWDPASCANNASVSTTVAVTGAVLGDVCAAAFSLDLQGLTISAHVSTTNTVKVVLQNSSGGIVDLGSGTLKVVVIRAF